MNYLAILPLLLTVLVGSAFKQPEPRNDTFEIFTPAMGNNESGFHPRIVNGQIAARRQFAYLAAVIAKDGWHRWLCGGSLISNTWVITAAACTKKFSVLIVKLGMLYLDDKKGVAVYEVHKESVFRPVGNNFGTQADIALIQIPNTKYTPTIKHVDLPQKLGDDVSTAGIASGWGYTHNRGPVSNIVRYVTLNIIPIEACEKYYGKKVITDANICTRSVNSGVCVSDTGGPLISAQSNLLIGITSLGPREGCSSGFPEAFTRVAFYRQWINATTGI